MKIQINSDKNVAVDAKLSSAIESDVLRLLGKFESRVTRLEVHLSDLNSSSKRGLKDMRCLLEARPAGQKPVSVVFEAASAEQAVRGAANKMKRLLETSFGKSSDHTSQKSARETKRGSNSSASLGKLQRIQTALAEIFEDATSESPRLERHMTTAIKALNEVRAIVESQNEPTKPPASKRASAPVKKSVAATKKPASGRSPKTKAIYRARRKSWPQR
jgi:hypothetical protein